jgi:hypothetical protein
MPPPAFIVFVDPFAKYGDDNPPDQASMLVQRLVAAGYNPYVDARGQPFLNHVNAQCGFVVMADGTVQMCDEYTGGKILCLHFYDQATLDSEEMRYIIAQMAPLYELAGPCEYDTAIEYDYLHEYIEPLKVQPTIEHSDFLGNNIRIFENHAFVIDPAPEPNAAKREATLVE